MGSEGAEPNVTVAPDGTLYVNANGVATLYRSDDDGATWKRLHPDTSIGLLTNSDSSVAIDPTGVVYMTFFNNYGDSTAVCSSTDRGETWGCNPLAVAGVTDRMWIFAPDAQNLYLMTNQGTSQSVLASSTDGGDSWSIRSTDTSTREGDTGPLIKRTASGDILEPVVGAGVDGYPEGLRVFQLSAPIPTTVFRPSGLTWTTGLPTAGVDATGAIYLAGEQFSEGSGVALGVARTTDDGLHWTVLPIVPGTETGTVTFPWIVAGRKGHVGIIYYYTTLSGDPETIIGDWSVMWAESFNADAADPDWTVVEIEHDVRLGGGVCSNLNCDGDTESNGNRFAADFIGAAIDVNDDAHLVWQYSPDAPSGVNEIHYQRLVEQPDVDPDALSFTTQTAVDTATEVESNVITISGINAAAPVDVSGGEYSVNGGSYLASAGSISNGQTLRLRQVSAAAQNASSVTTVTVGGVSATFTSITADTTPNAFSFTDQTGVAPGTEMRSNTITVGGINAPATISVAGGDYSVNGGSFTAADGSVSNGQTVQLRHGSASTPNTSTQTILTIGGVSATFTSTTAVAPVDTTPDAFAFVDQSAVATGAEVRSNIITISGINAAAPISVSGGEYSIDGAGFTATNSSIGNGQTLQLRHTAASAASTIMQTTVTVGGVSRTFKSTTAAAAPAPAAEGGGGGGALSLFSVLGLAGLRLLRRSPAMRACSRRATGT